MKTRLEGVVMGALGGFIVGLMVAAQLIANSQACQ